MKSTFTLIALIAASLVARAAPITWGPAANTTGKNQLIEGQVVLAVSGGTGASITGAGTSASSNFTFTGVNYQDLSFTPAPGNRIATDVSNGTPGTGDANFDTILKSFTDASANIASGTQTITGLTSGAGYRIQVFFNDQRATYNTRVMTFGDGASPAHNVNVSAGGSGWGQHAIGSFTAAGSTQSLTHSANGFANVHFNAILVVRDVTPAAPTAPARLSAAPGNGVVYLDWDDNTQFGFSHFIVRRSTSPGGPYAAIPGATPAASLFTDTDLANGTTYYYVVAAANTLGQISQNSAEAAATPQAGSAPPNFLFIITDDQNTYALGAYRRSEPAEPGADGQPYEIDTPNMDRLAAEGMLFHNARHHGLLDRGGLHRLAHLHHDRPQHLGRENRTTTAPASPPTPFPASSTAASAAACPACPTPPTAPARAATATRPPTEFQFVRDSTKRGNTDGNGSEWHADWAIDPTSRTGGPPTARTANRSSSNSASPTRTTSGWPAPTRI
jgi:hypothetical protein